MDLQCKNDVRHGSAKTMLDTMLDMDLQKQCQTWICKNDVRHGSAKTMLDMDLQKRC